MSELLFVCDHFSLYSPFPKSSREETNMGLADRDYMQERRRVGRTLPPPESSATSTLLLILALLAITYGGYKALTWWTISHQPTPVTPLAPTPRTHQPAANPNQTNYGVPQSAMPTSAMPASPRAPGTFVIKCMVNGVTTYAASESDCAANAKSTTVNIDRNQNLADGLPGAEQIIRRPSPSVQIDSPSAGIDPNIQRRAACQAYEEEVKRIDERARQPLSGQEQDWLAAKRKNARDAQFRLHC